MRTHVRPQNWAETAVFDQPVEAIQSTRERLSSRDFDEFQLAVMTAIAQGDRVDLEGAFPDLAGANPENGDWPFICATRGG